MYGLIQKSTLASDHPVERLFKNKKIIKKCLHKIAYSYRNIFKAQKMQNLLKTHPNYICADSILISTFDFQLNRHCIIE